MSEYLVKLLLDMKNEIARLELTTDETNKVINTFLLRYCIHDVITDHVDITPDKCIMIRYCKKCEVTL